MYITAEGNAPITYEEWMILEDIVEETKREIAEKNAKTNIKKARIIEHVVLSKISSTIHWGDEDFYTSCDKNLIEVLREGRGSCAHFAALTQYLHLRNGMYSDIINSNIHVKDYSERKIRHAFNLLFLDDEEARWTFVDTMWEGKVLKLRDQNRFSFVALEDMQNDPIDNYGAHKDVCQDLNNVPIASFDMSEIDAELGYRNKIYLFQYCEYIAYYIAHENIDKIMEIFIPEDESVQKLLQKNAMIQYIGFISYISAVELGANIKGQNREEKDMVRCLDTYLGLILPKLYFRFFRDRLQLINSSGETKKIEELYKQATNLFDIVQNNSGNLGICFDDTIDRAYIGVDFNRLNGFPYIEVLNSLQFEEKFGKTKENKSDSIQKEELKPEEYI